MNSISPTSSLANVHYYACLLTDGEHFLETKEHFQKRTYRNRFEIIGANGIQSLSIPLVKTPGIKQNIQEIKIAYEEEWHVKHWRSICAAYASSPFFEYYELDFQVLFSGKIETLFEWNTKAHNIVCEIIGIENTLKPNNAYQNSFEGLDLRSSFRNRFAFLPEEDYPTYNQVFEDRLPFAANLSILDLIFNKGNETLPYLTDIAQKTRA